ncbi:MAG: DUF2155 domain-containing protein [Brevundimonas sp.]|uniref:DUF2155 domain-containing protein n=1 Tax=Brevundimonas albigilva TaxID=1312364 RepID=A0ABY4STW0_9CAUL|nr:MULTISPECIES: DUF2155 domain-containing protein [Brevundimonas]PZU58122.1 MAG: DUF2155 domain-containing protein [Brevundimonas sp.]UQV18681.1 DUF2155 domain-containing protein [Brevundimonas albigilva]URI16539.1 DUF2155 domain-containing protein [Brevundimonas albigilva]
MRLNRLLLGGAALTAVLSAGAVTASVLQDAPRDARPVQSGDPIGDALRATSPAPSAAPVEAPPAASPAPASPVPVTPPPVIVVAQDAAVEEAAQAETEQEAPVAEKAIDQPEVPARRQRRKFAVVQAIDKVTAETMKFEVEVGGRPVRFNRTLIVAARACEVSTPDELTQDSIAYLDVSLAPRNQGEPRQIFRGWMFASSPAVSGLQNPSYDAWVVGCKD